MPSLVIKIKPIGTQKRSLVIVVGKRVSKKATERNLLKRRIRVIMRPIVRSLRYYFIVIVKPEAAKLTYRELKKEVERKILNIK